MFERTWGFKSPLAHQMATRHQIRARDVAMSVEAKLGVLAAGPVWGCGRNVGDRWRWHMPKHAGLLAVACMAFGWRKTRQLGPTRLPDGAPDVRVVWFGQVIRPSVEMASVARLSEGQR